MIRSNELNLGGLAVPAIFSQFDSLHLNAKNAIKKIDDIIRDTDDKLEEKYAPFFLFQKSFQDFFCCHFFYFFQ